MKKDDLLGLVSWDVSVSVLHDAFEMGMRSHVWTCTSVLIAGRPAFEHLQVRSDQCRSLAACFLAPNTQAVQRAQATHMLLKPGMQLCDSPHSGMASPSGPLAAPNSSVSDDGRGCDDESGDPTYAPVPRKASLSSGDSESAPEHAHGLSGSGSGFSDAAHVGAGRVRRILS